MKPLDTHRSRNTNRNRECAQNMGHTRSQLGAESGTHMEVGYMHGARLWEWKQKTHKKLEPYTESGDTEGNKAHTQS